MLREEMKRQINEIKDKGVISEAATEWSAPVILLSKKATDETKRCRFVAVSRVEQCDPSSLAFSPREHRQVKGKSVFHSRRYGGCLLSHADP
jgi:hypothetical protein